MNKEIKSILLNLPYKVMTSKESEKLYELSEQTTKFLRTVFNLNDGISFKIKDGVEVEISINPQKQNFTQKANSVKLSSILAKNELNEIIEVPYLTVKLICNGNEANFIWEEFEINVLYNGKKESVSKIYENVGFHNSGEWTISFDSFDLFNYLYEKDLYIYNQIKE